MNSASNVRISATAAEGSAATVVSTCNVIVSVKRTLRSGWNTSLPATLGSSDVDPQWTVHLNSTRVHIQPFTFEVMLLQRGGGC